MYVRHLHILFLYFNFKTSFTYLFLFLFQHGYMVISLKLIKAVYLNYLHK